MSDLIERQAAIDAIQNWLNHDTGYSWGEKNVMKCAISELMDLPSVSMGKTRWIPVSERAPEFLEDVLMCDAGGDIAVGYFRQGEYVNGQKYTKWCVYGYDEDFRAVAWCELPEPYKGESENAE